MNPTVLLVDDDANLLDGMCRALRKEPYAILRAGSAEEALEILSRRPIDVVISDEEMPGMSGTKLLRRVRQIYPETIRFILTGKATLDAAIEAINDGGVSRFFIKPYDCADLAVSIRQGLQQRELMLAARLLLKEARRQSEPIERLEKEYPHITEVTRDDDGTIVLSERSGDFDQLAQEIYDHLDHGK
jgi:DNA-binding NtrC family response regulator